MKYPTAGELGHHEQLSYDLLTAEKGHDMTLVGADGVKVGVIQRILINNSDVLTRLVQGGFKEASQKEIVLVGFNGQTIAEAFYFMVMIEVTPLYLTDTNSRKRKATHDVNGALELYRFARFYMMPELEKKLLPAFAEITSNWPEAHYDIFNYFHGQDMTGSDLLPLAPTTLIDNARKHIRSSLQTIEPEQVASLNINALIAIVQDRYLEADEYDLLLLLKTWANTPKRKDAVQTVIEHIRLDKIEPSMLRTFQEEADGLVDSMVFMEAYRTQAILLSKKGTHIFQEPRAWTASVGDGEPKKIKVSGTGKGDLDGVYTKISPCTFQKKDTTDSFFIMKGERAHKMFSCYEGTLGWCIVRTARLGYDTAYYSAPATQEQRCPPEGTQWKDQLGNGQPKLFYQF